MAVTEAVVARIQKLLALAGNNSNEHEAASAAAKAQALMQEHDLAMEQVEGMKVDPRLQGITEAERITLRKAGKPGGWKVKLFEAVGKTSDCWAYASEGTKYYDGTGRLIGRTQDVQMAHYIFDFLVRELERLQEVYGKEKWAELREYAKDQSISTHHAERRFSIRGDHPLKSKNSWVIGASEAVMSNLYQAQRERNATTEANALVVNKAAAINDWWAVKNGYESWADYLAKSRAKSAVVTTDTKAKRLSARDIARMEAAANRAYEQQRRAEQRRWESLDHTAYRRGQEEGRQIGVRPGVERGATDKAVLLD